MTTRPKYSSYFELPRRLSQSHDSEDVSPLSGPSGTPAYSRRSRTRPRLGHSSRSRSDDTFAKPRVQVIGADDFIQYSRTSRPSTTTTRPDSFYKPHRVSATTDSKSRVSMDDASDSRRVRSSHFSYSEGSSSDAGRGSASRNSRISSTWSKALTRSSPFDRHVSGGDSAACSRDIRSLVDATEASAIPIQPLRPPSLGAKHFATPSEHQIMVEETFPDDSTPGGSSFPPILPAHRSSSISPLHLFSVPLSVFHKIGKRNNRQTYHTTQSHRMSLGYQLPAPLDHPTNLRKHETANILRRATSMLQEIISHGSRPTAGKVAPANISKMTGQSPTDDQLKVPAPLGRVRSMELSLEETESQSSSIAKLKLGPAPHNTPDEAAKYTIINQEGELEEFFKVDISIRGYTSYLPSEARRIHTPPLPGDGGGGKRRGFFFDYNLPSVDQPHTRRHGISRSGEVSKTQNEADTGKDFPDLGLTRNRYLSPRVKGGEWYEAQLAEVDSLVEDDLRFRSQVPVMPPDRINTSYSDSIPDLLVDEEQLDYNIPEHYPTSPLCPRHPRYWKVMKNKGNQFRGCWMHGYGEFSDAENVAHGI